MLPDPRARPVYIGSEIYRKSTYGPGHPLAIPRVSTCTDLIRAMGWLDEAQYVEAPMATDAEITRFHDPDYLAALKRAEARQAVTAEDREKFRIGADSNPVYREVFRRPATSAGGSMLAARLVAEGGVVHCPGGGTHHGRRDRASGFCYLNDPVLTLTTWLDLGLDTLVYLDLDAHHGDGVQDAFAGDPRVLAISIHEAGRWPFTGAAEDRAGGSARNLPVPPGLNDSEHRHLMRQAVLPLIEARRPQAILVQTGADSLEEDPLAKLALFRRRRRGADAGAEAGRGRRGRLQPVHRRAVLGGDLGRAERPGHPRPHHGGGGGGAARAGLQPRRRPQPAGTLVHHPARCAARGAGATRDRTPGRAGP